MHNTTQMLHSTYQSYLDELSIVSVVSRSHLRLRNMYNHYGKDAVDQLGERHRQQVQAGHAKMYVLQEYIGTARDK